MDVDEPSRAFGASASSSSSANTLHFGTNTPFIFHSAPRSPAYEPYDPSKWAAKDFKFGFAGGASGLGNAEDVEMRPGDSPARTKPSAEQEQDVPLERSKGDEQAKQGKLDEGHFEVGQGTEVEPEGRKIASGAVSRVRRRRQKEWRRRRDSDSDQDEVSPAVNVGGAMYRVELMRSAPHGSIEIGTSLQSTHADSGAPALRDTVHPPRVSYSPEACIAGTAGSYAKGGQLPAVLCQRVDRGVLHLSRRPVRPHCQTRRQGPHA